MKRRTFLKAILSAIATVLLPKLPVDSGPFKDGYKYHKTIQADSKGGYFVHPSLAKELYAPPDIDIVYNLIDRNGHYIWKGKL